MRSVKLFVDLLFLSMFAYVSRWIIILLLMNCPILYKSVIVESRPRTRFQCPHRQPGERSGIRPAAALQGKNKGLAVQDGATFEMTS